MLDKTAQNLCEISLEGQRTYLQSIGTDTADLADMETLKVNTGPQAFLEAHLTFCDAMEDLSLKISIQQEELSYGCFTGKPYPLRLLAEVWVDGAEARYSISNEAFTEQPFSFRPSDPQCLDRIPETE